MLFPLRSDAPVDHFPWATLGVAAANVAAHVWAHGASATEVERFVLLYGQWAPWQWLTSAFLHSGWGHLVGNLVFLWSFGLIVEGKTGWLRFLAVYGSIAVLSNAFEQTVMLGATGGSLGASGVIYGLMAIAMVWAPENDFDCLLAVHPAAVRVVEVPVFWFGAFYVAMQFVFALFDGFRVGSALLHLIGAAAGLPIGILMLRRGWVDCQGWDWFSRRRKHALPPRVRDRGDSRGASSPRIRREDLRPASVQFTSCVAAGDLDGALRVHSGLPASVRATLPLAVRERLVRSLDGAGRAADARPVARGMLDDDPGRPAAGLLEARLLLDEGRPSPAARLLDAVAPRLGDAADRRAHAALSARVAERRAAGGLEFAD